MVRTLGDVLTQRTADTFVGRAEELAGLLAMLDANDPPVIVLHGIAGKSSLLAPDHLSGAGATAHENVPDRTTDLDAIVRAGILGTQPCEIARGQSLVHEGLEGRAMDRARLNEVEFEYEVKGSGEPVLLISTGPIADSFLPFLSEKMLVECYRLIRYRQRRMGNRAPSSVPVSFEQHAADAAALLGHLGVRRAHVAGHSTGAVIALQLAADRPEMVHTLALLEPTLVGVPSAAAFLPSTFAVLEAVGPALAAYGSGDRKGAMAGFLSVVCSLDWETCRALVEKHVPGGVAQAMEGADNWFGSYLPALNAWQFGPKVASAISQPVLSVLGTESGPLFEEGHALLHFWFPQVEDCAIEGVAHLLHIQRPEPVARGVAEFLARHPITRD